MLRFLKKRKYLKQLEELEYAHIRFVLREPKDYINGKLFKKDLKIIKKYFKEYLPKRAGVCDYLIGECADLFYHDDGELPKSLNDFRFDKYMIDVGHTSINLYYKDSKKFLRVKDELPTKLKTIDIHSSIFNTPTSCGFIYYLNLYLAQMSPSMCSPEKISPDKDICSDCESVSVVLELSNRDTLNFVCDVCGDLTSSTKDKKLIKKVINDFKNHVVEYKDV